MCGELSPCSGLTGFAPHRGVCAFPVCPAQAPGCSIWSGPCAECGSSFRVLHKSADSVAPAFCAFPCLSGSGSQELDGCTLPGCGAPCPLRGPSLSFCAPCVCSQELASSHDHPGCRPSRISGSLWIETGGLFAVWEGMPSLGLSLPLSPPTCLLPPVGDGPICHQLALLWDLSVLSLFCKQARSVLGLVNFLSLSCYPTV